MAQLHTESIDQYVTRLRQKADYCQFGDKVDENIRDQVIEKCLSNRLRTKLLEKGAGLTLTQLQTMARAMEASATQAESIASSNTTHEVNRVQSKRDKPKRQRNRGTNDKEKRCYRCDNLGHLSTDEKCPARGKKCNKCQLTGHFAKCCKSKRKNNDQKPVGGKDTAHLVETEDEFAFVVSGKTQPELALNVGGVPNIKFIIDSGASCNVIDRELWETLKASKVKCESRKGQKKLFAYGSTEPLKVAGSFTACIQLGQQTHNAEFIVIEGKGQALLGRDTAMQLGILKITDPDSLSANVVEEENTGDMLFKTYEQCFQGIGKLKDFQLEIPIDVTITPVAQQPRRIPLSQRAKLAEKLEELEKLDIIEKAEGPTPWVSPVVIVPKKNNDIRLCVDMRQANEAVIRERHPIPTVDEVLQELNQGTVFSKLDVKWAFHQIELKEESRGITTFATHQGLYRYKRLMFGISCAPEMYQRVIQQFLQDCEGAQNLYDDIVVHGATKEEHDERLKVVLQKIQDKGLTLNKEKCKFHMSELEFMGHLLSARGIGPTKAKVEAVTNARRPETVSEVRSFLGLVNYCGKFIPDLATVADPLRKLTRQNEPFVWTNEQEHSFTELKKRLTNAETLGYFNLEAKTAIIADASPVGLGAVLVQTQNGESRVICYASRSLSDVERRYSQTEKEALALVWACERFHMYVYGIDFELLTDHKPLEFIYSRKSHASARVNRWVLRLQPYSFVVKHIPGKTNIADSLSRLTSKTTEPDSETEEYVRYVAESATPKAMSTREIEEASAVDPELSNLRKCHRENKWNNLQNKRYLLIRNEISVIGKLVLRGTRIIIPESLRGKVLQIAHEGHPGIVTMKRRLRTKVWWPGLDKGVEEACKTCHPCQVVGAPNPPEPVKTTELPNGPWQHLAIDLMTPCLPSGDHVFAVVDYYSRYIEIQVMKSTTTDKIIASLKRMFLTHGLPISVTTDNGPQFISDEFRKFMENEGIHHRHTTPLWPQANGEIERQNRSLLKRIRIAQIENKDWKEELGAYLTMYRTTPHSTTGVSPAELLFGRKLRTRLPGLEESTVEDVEVKDRDSEAKEKGKLYTDKKRQAKPSDVKVGDSVLLKQKSLNKMTPPFDPQPYQVVSKAGSSVTVQSPSGAQYKRNSSHVKIFNEPKSLEQNKEDELNCDEIPKTHSENKVDHHAHDEHSTQSQTSPIESATPNESVTNESTVQSNIKDTVIARPTRLRRTPTRFKDFEL